MHIFYLNLYAKRVQIGNCYCNRSTNMAALLRPLKNKEMEGRGVLRIKRREGKGWQ